MGINMRLVKGFLIVIAGFFVLITLISLLIPSKVVTVKSVTIHAPQEKIIAAISDLDNWRKWHPVFTMPGNQIVISRPSSGKNANARWQQNGKETAITITDNFAQGIKFDVSREGESAVHTSLAALPMQEPGTYQVEWKALSKLKWYPWEKFAGIFMSEMTGPGYEASLNQLKKFIENP
jgi:hypothetical protein